MNDDATKPCDRLDDYFDDDLSLADRAAFEAHLGQCDACRDAVDQQRWVDELLQSPAAAYLELAPAIVSMGAHRARPAPWIVAIASAAAAAAIMLATLPTDRRPRDALPDEMPVAAAAQESADQRQSPPQPSVRVGPSTPTTVDVFETTPSRATFVSTSDAIAVPIESGDPDVTIVQLYPTVSPWPRIDDGYAAYTTSATIMGD